MRETGSLIACLLDFAQLRPGWRRRRDLLKRQRGIPVNHRQEIVEVVRDAGSEFPNRFELLRMPQTFFEIPPFRDVPRDGFDSSELAAAVVDVGIALFDPYIGAALIHPT